MIDPIFAENLKKYNQTIQLLEGYIIESGMESKLEQLNIQANSPNLWDQPEEAQKILQQKASLEKNFNLINKVCEEFKTAEELLQLAESDDNKSDLQECVNSLNSLFKQIDQIETRRLLSDPQDENNAFLEINSGAGGTESQDWAQMLLRMYTRWAEEEGFKTELLDVNSGETAGIKSVTLSIKGNYAYGLLKTEIGVHRLVRISPFDSQNRRHTSFASVFVYPEINSDINIEINPDELRIDTFRASGAGGQHVNTTDSAIRITHIPTKTVVQCQNQRSQHKNKDEAMKMLKAKLYEIELNKQNSEKQALEDTKTDNAWGHQIRSYVLHPYKMIKDLRTNIETSNIDKILNGDLNKFINAELNRRNTL